MAPRGLTYNLLQKSLKEFIISGKNQNILNFRNANKSYTNIMDSIVRKIDACCFLDARKSIIQGKLH